MNLQRRLALAISLLAVGLGTGHFVQSRAKERAEAAPRPEKIEQLSAGVGKVTMANPSLAAFPDTATNGATGNAAPGGVVLAEAEKACPLEMHLLAESNAMIALALAAPCQADQRVVVKHGGLAVTAQTSSAGMLTLSLPAMEEQAKVTISFVDGSVVHGRVSVPEVKSLQRFAVQWMADDHFDLQAYEDGADFGEPGNISATNPKTPAPGIVAQDGYLTTLGDKAVSLPMQAQVYTFPRHVSAEVMVEAAVSPSTCGREMLGEAVSSVGGKITVSEVTLAMPDCDVPGGILVLKNIVPEMKVAAR